MIILDFDGVIVDSIDEVLVTTYLAISGDAVSGLEVLPKHYAAIFRANRFHVQPAGDLLLLAEWAAKQPADGSLPVMSRQEYERLVNPHAATTAERTAKFFAARRVLRDKVGAGWYGLNRPFEPLWENLCVIPAEHVYILTNKNREAVLDLCRHFGKELLPGNIYAGDGGKTKIENLIALSPPSGRPALFIDDSVYNLVELHDAFARNIARKLDLALATWGYLGPDDVAHATGHSFGIFTQQDLIGRLRRESRA